MHAKRDSANDDELALADAFLESLKSAGIDITEKKRFSLPNSESESDDEPHSSRTSEPKTSMDHHKTSGQIPSDDDTAAEERPVARLKPTESPPHDPDDPDWQPEEDDNQMNDDEPPDDNEPEEHDIVENGLSSGDRLVSGNSGNTNQRTEEPRNQPMQRKRKAEPLSWFDNKNKALRESGKPYVGWIKPAKDATSRRGCPRPERCIGPPCISPACEASQKRFCSSFSADQRERLFQKFWSDMTWDQRKVYISSLIRTSSVKRSRSNSDEGSRRNVSLQYFLKKDDGSSYAVCKKMFLSTFGLKEKQVYNWAMEGSVNSGMARPSYKEVNKGRTRPERPDFVWLKEFLDSLAKLPSHYCRKSTAKVYLEPVFSSDTMAAVYRVYVGACTDNDRMVLSRHTFSKVAKAMNIGFQLPKKDKCDLCCSYQSGNLSKEEYDAHEADKEEARKQKAEDKKRSEANEITMLTMDLMAVKVAPFLNASSLYFKTKLLASLDHLSLEVLEAV
ncbi:hypothetical protein GE061_011182 [Apolygus lucorum]|uniref:Uncharacterized protein n=1 Tax=Apolygus lucorum TaxID=248454 RepID=A0A8S9XX09_APOLU|nr:hypothetical protein GE061_011182 [Apolygus lucorum]